MEDKMKFCRQKILLLLVSAILGILLLPAWKIGEKVNIQTLDGYLYADAELMSVNDGGITIRYTNVQKEPVLLGITFDRLPMELRLRFGYDPEKFAEYQKNVGTYRPPEPAKSAPEKKPNGPKSETVPDASNPQQTATSLSGAEEELVEAVIPVEWYYRVPSYTVWNYPAPPPPRPPHRPGPHRPGPHRPGPHRPGPNKPGPNKPGPNKPPVPKPVPPKRPVQNRPAGTNPAPSRPQINRPQVNKPAPHRPVSRPQFPAGRPGR